MHVMWERVEHPHTASHDDHQQPSALAILRLREYKCYSCCIFGVSAETEKRCSEHKHTRFRIQTNDLCVCVSYCRMYARFIIIISVSFKRLSSFVWRIEHSDCTVRCSNFSLSVYMQQANQTNTFTEHPYTHIHTEIEWDGVLDSIHLPHICRDREHSFILHSKEKWDENTSQV